MVHEEPDEEGDQPQCVFLPAPSLVFLLHILHGWLVLLVFFTAALSYICISSAMGVLPAAQTAPAHFPTLYVWTSLHCLPLTLFSQPSLSCFQITYSLIPRTGQLLVGLAGYLPSWLNSSSSSWSQYPGLMLDPASVYVFLYVLLVSFLLFLTSPNPSSGLTLSSMKLASSTAPLWTSLDLEFPTVSLSVAYMIILSAYTSKPTVVELLLRGVPAPKELTVWAASQCYTIFHTRVLIPLCISWQSENNELFLGFLHFQSDESSIVNSG